MTKCSNTKICNIFPVDIRLIICDVSFDELILNINSPKYYDEFNISVIEYFKYLYDPLFDSRLHSLMKEHILEIRNDIKKKIAHYT